MACQGRVQLWAELQEFWHIESSNHASGEHRDDKCVWKGLHPDSHCRQHAQCLFERWQIWGGTHTENNLPIAWPGHELSRLHATFGQGELPDVRHPCGNVKR